MKCHQNLFDNTSISKFINGCILLIDIGYLLKTQQKRQFTFTVLNGKDEHFSRVGKCDFKYEFHQQQNEDQY